MIEESLRGEWNKEREMDISLQWNNVWRSNVGLDSFFKICSVFELMFDLISFCDSDNTSIAAQS